MSYQKEDFLLMKNAGGFDVLINIPQIKFITWNPENLDCCNFFFDADNDDFLMVKTTLEEFLELL